MRFERRLFPAAALGYAAVVTRSARAATEEGKALRDALLREAELPSKKSWRPMLLYLAELHGKSVHPPIAHFQYPYEDIGPGYQNGMAFGHIDLTHERLDTVRALPEHVRNQTRNELKGQQADGLVPGVINFTADGKPSWKDFKGFPPIWPAAVDAYVEATADTDFLKECLAALLRQIGWFETKRAVPGDGFYYLDALQPTWESGMDEGIRYDERPSGPAACIDACSHVFGMYDHAARWSQKLSQPADKWQEKAKALQSLIQSKLWNDESGFFYDTWTVNSAAGRHWAFEGMWPVVVGAATAEQARRVIDKHLLNPQEFFTPHPISTVGVNDSKFELRMWRGPAWNCMTYWAARGCVRYGERAAARKLLEAALDVTAIQFERTGTIWEFYHPFLGEQEKLFRKPSGRRIPCRDYLGHNPLFAMADLWRTTG